MAANPQQRPTYNWGHIELVPNGEFRQPREGDYFLNDSGRPMLQGDDGAAEGWRAILIPKHLADAAVAVSWDDGDEERGGEAEPFVVVCGECFAEVDELELKKNVEVRSYRVKTFYPELEEYEADYGHDLDEIQNQLDYAIETAAESDYDWDETDTYEDPYQDPEVTVECPMCGDPAEFIVTTKEAQARARAMRDSGLSAREARTTLRSAS